MTGNPVSNEAIILNKTIREVRLDNVELVKPPKKQKKK
jgi:hypothetical protein